MSAPDENKRPNKSWGNQISNDGTTSASDLLIRWLGEGDNLERYKRAARITVSQEIQEYLQQHGIQGRTAKSIRTKADRMLLSFATAKKWLADSEQTILATLYNINSDRNAEIQQEKIKSR